MALLAVLARTTIRLRHRRQFSADDLFLYFGVICLCAAMGLLVKYFEDMYLTEAFMINPLAMDISPTNLSSLFRFHNVIIAYITLTYTTLFSVKLSFLFFFRNLVRRVRRMMIYWWTVLGIMIVTWLLFVLIIILGFCSYFDERVCKTSISLDFFLSNLELTDIAGTCEQESELPRFIGLTALLTVLDIATDILCTSYPSYRCIEQCDWLNLSTPF